MDRDVRYFAGGSLSSDALRQLSDAQDGGNLEDSESHDDSLEDSGSHESEEQFQDALEQLDLGGESHDYHVKSHNLRPCLFNISLSSSYSGMNL